MDNSLKERVLEATDIVALVGERVSLTRKGKDFVGLCPFHDDHKPSMAVSPSKGIFKCWSCGAGGDAIKFVMLRERLPFPEALASLATRAGIDLRRERNPASQANESAREDLRRVLAWARTHFHRVLNETPGGHAAREYAHSRGISDATIDELKIGFANESWDELGLAAGRAGIRPELLTQAGLTATNEKGRTYDRFRNRLIFPICDPQSRPVAFGGRALGDDPAKYLNSPESPLFSKSRLLFNLDRARAHIERAKEALIVEGYIDAVLVYQAGVGHVVATLGTALTDSHVKLLKPMTDRLIMCFDSDDAGYRAADRALEAGLRHQLDVQVAQMEPDQDPADCIQQKGVQAFRSFLLSSISALEFKWLATLRTYGDNPGRGRRDALNAYLGFIARSTVAGGLTALDEGWLISRVADLLQLPGRAVYDAVAELKAGLKRPTAPTSDVAGDISELAAYDAAIRGLPAGLVVAAEELLGIVLSDADWFRSLDPQLAALADKCEVWERFYRLLGEVEGEYGRVNRADVISLCDDADQCDLIERSIRRCSGTAITSELVESVRRKVDSELERARLVEQKEVAANSVDELQRAAAFLALADAKRRSGRAGAVPQN